MNDVEKIDDCMVDVFCNAYAENKKTILVLASRMVSFCLVLFLKERYEYWFISIFIALSLRHL